MGFVRWSRQIRQADRDRNACSATSPVVRRVADDSCHPPQDRGAAQLVDRANCAHECVLYKILRVASIGEARHSDESRPVAFELADRFVSGPIAG